MKQFQKRKGMNPALAAMKAEHKNNMLIRASHKANMLLTIMVLHDKFGFGEKRLFRFIDEEAKLLEAYNEGYLNVQDIEDTLKEEVGIEVRL